MRGADKLLERVAGQPLLRRQAEVALATGHPVLLTLPPADRARRAALAGLSVTLLEVPDATSGMSASLRAAARHVAGALLVLPADMPELDTEDLGRVIAAFLRDPSRCVRGAGPSGEPGHPVALPARLLPEIRALTGDDGARSLLARHGVTLVPLPARHALTDLDTPEDWRAWRSGSTEPGQGP